MIPIDPGLLLYMLDGHTPVRCEDPLTWSRWFSTHHEERVVATTGIADVIRVSTVFLGIDHNFSGEGDPVVFETMVFTDDGYMHPLNEEQWRYTDWDSAKTGHDHAVSLVRAELALMGSEAATRDIIAAAFDDDGEGVDT